METWEYMVVRLNSTVWNSKPGWGDVLKVEQLNELGAAGWDVAADWRVDEEPYPVLLLKRRNHECGANEVG